MAKPPSDKTNATRADRLAAELRANLLRRKQQARSRKDADAGGKIDSTAAGSIAAADRDPE